MNKLDIYKKPNRIGKAWLLLCCMVLSAVTHADGMSPYGALVESVANLPSAEIVKLGDLCVKNRNKEKALAYYIMVSNRTQEKWNEKEMEHVSDASMKAGNIYYWSGSYAIALKFYVNGLKICDGSKKKKRIMEYYKCIGNVYCMFKEYEKALDYYRKGLSLTDQIPDKFSLLALLNNCCYVNILLGNTQEAKEYYRRMQRTNDRNNVVFPFLIRFNLALIKASEGRYREAVDMQKRLAVYAHRHKLAPNYECSALEEVYKAYFRMNEYDSTLHYVDRCRQTAEREGLRHMYSEAFDMMAAVYLKKGEIQKSQYYKAKYLSLKDSIFNKREFEMAKNQQFMYEMDKINQAMTDLQHKNERSRQVIIYQRVLIGSILLTALVVSLLLLFVHRQKKRLNNNYRNLYLVNRKLAESYRHADATRQQYREELNERNERIGMLTEQLERMGAGGDDGNVPAGQEETGKAKCYTGNLTGKHSQSLADAIENVMKNTMEYCREDFSLALLAEIVDSNTKYVSQVINETFGKSFNTYVNEYRIQMACMRLSDVEKYENYTIRAIGESVGFKSPTTFIGMFKKQYGITPSVYRKMAKNHFSY